MPETDKQEPTRRPWEIYDFNGEVKVYAKTIIIAPTGESICEVAGGWPQCTIAENEANAKLIVRAVNSHEALVQSLRDHADTIHGEVHSKTCGALRGGMCSTPSRCLRINEALALAEKGSE